MGRSIQWASGVLDEMVLVYEKTAENPAAENLLSRLEQSALAEARAHCGLVTSKGCLIKPSEYDLLTDEVKEALMWALSQVGLAAFSALMDEAKIIVRLSPRIQEVRCSTAFSILNRLEKLDGAYDAVHLRAKLEMQAPLGGKKGLMPIEALIAMLYPWLAGSETSTKEVAVKLALPRPAAAKPAPASQKDIQQEKSGASRRGSSAGSHKPDGHRRPSRRDIHREYKKASGADPCMDRPGCLFLSHTKSKNVCTAGFLQSFRHMSR